MAFEQTRLIGPVALGTSSTSPLYTVPPDTTTIVKELILASVASASSSNTVNVWLVPSGQIVDDVYKIADSWVVNGKETVIVDFSLVMDVDDRIFASADTGSVVNITVSGIEEV